MRGEGREKERERNIDAREKHPLLSSLGTPDWDRKQTRNPGMCPDWESNLSLCRRTANQLGHTSWANKLSFQQQSSDLLASPRITSTF